MNKIIYRLLPVIFTRKYINISAIIIISVVLLLFFDSMTSVEEIENDGSHLFASTQIKTVKSDVERILNDFSRNNDEAELSHQLHLIAANLELAYISLTEGVAVDRKDRESKPAELSDIIELLDFVSYEGGMYIDPVTDIHKLNSLIDTENEIENVTTTLYSIQNKEDIPQIETLHSDMQIIEKEYAKLREQFYIRFDDSIEELENSNTRILILVAVLLLVVVTLFNIDITYISSLREQIKKQDIALKISKIDKQIAENDYFPFFQPIVDINTGRIVGMESLCRLFEDEKMIPPVEFIPFMEEHDLISNLDLSILKQAAEVLENLLTNNTVDKDFYLSFNISIQTLKNTELNHIIEEIIATHKKLRSENLVLEVTETISNDNDMEISRKLSDISELGISISMDDFSAGNSSLNTFTNLPVNTVKFDLDLIRTASHNTKVKDVMHLVVNLSQKNNVSVICEGIETSEQLEIAKQIGTKYAQGYYFHKPMSASDFKSLCSG